MDNVDLSLLSQDTSPRRRLSPSRGPRTCHAGQADYYRMMSIKKSGQGGGRAEAIEVVVEPQAKTSQAGL